MKKLVIFAKSPVLGGVKTRLKGEKFSDEEILELYSAFLQDTIESAISSQAEKIVIAFYPSNREDLMRDLLAIINIKDDRIALIPQLGDLFEQRFLNIFDATKDEKDQWVVIGSDAPMLSPEIINNAFFAIQNEGIVVGPSGEGGVYLIGVHSRKKISFEGIFSDGIEICNIVGVAKKNYVQISLLQELTDIDMEQDLVGLVGILQAAEYGRESKMKQYYPKSTAAIIKRLGITAKRDRCSQTRDKVIVRRVDV